MIGFRCADRELRKAIRSLAADQEITLQELCLRAMRAYVANPGRS